MPSSGENVVKDKPDFHTGPEQDSNLHRSPADSLSDASIHEAHPGGLSHLADLVRSLSSRDAAARYREEAADDGIPDRNGRREGKEGSQFADREIISWEEGDKENPHNWTHVKRNRVLLTTMVLIINSTLGSSLPSMAIPYMAKEWGVTAQEQMPLPIATFLMGFVLGPMMWGPLSEQYGRRIVVVSTFSVFTIWTLACALAPNWPAFLVFRFLCGAFASAPIAAVAGVIADVYADPVARGRAMAYFMATTVFGPLFAPIISLTECPQGFCSTSIGWRWTFWIGLIYAGLTFIPVILLPETYAPVLLARKAAALRKRDPESNVYAAAELEDRDLKQLVTVVLTRPMRMILTELIVSSVCMYLALVYAIFYMSFQAFPRIFQDLYGLSPGVTGLCFLPIGGGCVLGLPIFFAYDHVLQRAQKTGKKWAKQEEYRRVPLACLGGPLFVVSLLWLGWSARPASGVPFVVPMLAGIPFGLGWMLIFMALINYLTDAYELFAASANAAASASRSLVAVVLPLATGPLFGRLGVAGACSLLAGLSALMCGIPFVFIWKGERIRAGSRFCAELRRRKGVVEGWKEGARESERGGNKGIMGM
ncbi:major facilitator superfamily transporter [Apiospora rasikravindrae]|uniref:Major facilitator superfamily transporter n=1 Tax=Apiospora rasikravindrae TaxID=990691 RepID=A0ABR1SZX8_9PEZI